MSLRAGVLAFCLLASPLAAQDDATQTALAALDRAEAELSAATSSREQRRALGRAIRAYERGLQVTGAARSRLGSALRTRERDLADRRAEVRRLLGGVARLGLISEPLMLTSAAAPQDALRARVVMDALARKVSAKTRALEAERNSLQALEAEQMQVQRALEQTRARLAEIRTALIERVEDDRLSAEPLPNIGEDMQNLAALAIALDSTLVDPDPEGLALEPGSLSLPLDAPLLRPFGAPDPAGLNRPGIAFAADPGAMVTAPAAASVRFTGEIDGFGAVVILEPQPEVLLVIAGLGPILVRASETVGRGAPLGFMPMSAAHEEFSDPAGDSTGQFPSKTLYIELRHNQRPVDPTPWFEPLR